MSNAKKDVVNSKTCAWICEKWDFSYDWRVKYVKSERGSRGHLRYGRSYMVIKLYHRLNRRICHMSHDWF